MAAHAAARPAARHPRDPGSSRSVQEPRCLSRHPKRSAYAERRVRCKGARRACTFGTPRDTFTSVRDLDMLTAGDFAALRGQRFSIAPDDDSPFDVELVGVTAIPREPGGREPFSVLFQGGPSPPLPQRIYRVEHERLGALEIFLVPIA